MPDDSELVEIDCEHCDDGTIEVPESIAEPIVDPTCGDCMAEEIDRRRDDPPQSFIGCYFCDEGNGWEDDDMDLDMEFDVFYHPECLAETEYDSVYDYIMAQEANYNEQ